MKKNPFVKAALRRGFKVSVTKTIDAENLEELINVADLLQQGQGTRDSIDTLYHGIYALKQAAENNSAEGRYIGEALKDVEDLRRATADYQEKIRRFSTGIYASLNSLSQLVDSGSDFRSWRSMRRIGSAREVMQENNDKWSEILERLSKGGKNASEDIDDADYMWEEFSAISRNSYSLNEEQKRAVAQTINSISAGLGRLKEGRFEEARREFKDAALSFSGLIELINQE